ncbi:MAG: metallophosphoesterase [Pirellulales bacterium]|nr:metallophosphoesterase [Pirellulales bacterium]
MTVTLLLLALFGHAVLWTGFVNRLHASAVPHRLINGLSYASLVAVITIPVALVARIWPAMAFDKLPVGWRVYVTICWVMAVVGITGWLWRLAIARRYHGEKLRLLGRRSISPLVDERHQHPLLALPGNQCLRVDVVERSLCLDRMHPGLDGLSIVHLSDLHFSGRIGKCYFEEVVRLSNEIEPDMVAITGDLIDKAHCIDWLPDTLGKLQSRHGVYFVLGNHDLRFDTYRLRKTLSELGLVDLGGRWSEISVDRDDNASKSENGKPDKCSIVLAGNELPWFPPAADMSDAPARRSDGQPLRILLSHSPDQLDWAIAADFDLMLAGHLHGGQIRIPLVGPILSPSRKGVKYASGMFYAKPTILHVSRGISSEVPLRFYCEPELAHLILRHTPTY